MMRTSDRGRVALAIKEGLVPAPYLDSVGVWTFGIGLAETSGLQPNPRLMPRGMPADLDGAIIAAFQQFGRVLEKYEAEVRRAVSVPVAQHEFDALVSFHYNTGGIARAALTRHLNAGDRAAAADAFMGWVRPPEVRGRREAEQRLFRDGTYPTGAAVGDRVLARFSRDLGGMLLTAHVSAANTVTCVFANLTGGAIDLASGTLTVERF